jgi:hypothetical protein
MSRVDFLAQITAGVGTDPEFIWVSDQFLVGEASGVGGSEIAVRVATVAGFRWFHDQGRGTLVRDGRICPPTFGHRSRMWT